MAQQQQQQQQQQKNKTTNNNKNTNEDNTMDNAWKAVGSPSRRGSTTAMNHFHEHDSPVNDPIEVIRRSSIVSETTPVNWGSFGGFQWEGPSIFDEDGKPVSIPPTQPAPNDYQQQQQQQQNNDILSVPMLPGVSLEPIYRQQRSLSFSMGQDPTFFGYDDYEDQPPPVHPPYTKFNSSLAPMVEEDDDLDDFDFAHIRSRSKSSGAAFGLLSQHQHSRLLGGHTRRGSEQQEDLLINQRRRSSSRFFNGEMSLGDKERLDIIQRRLSQQQQQQQQQQQEYTFPPENVMRRQSLTLNSQPPHNIQQLADQLENTHLTRSDYQPSQQQTYIRPELYMPQHNNNYHPTSYLQLQQQPYHTYHHPQQQQQQQPPPQQQQQQTSSQVADDYFETDTRGYQDLGKGIPLARLDPNVPLYMVEFKGGRTDFFYVLDSTQFHPFIGDLVIVEADRGKDLGKVAANTLSVDQVTELEQKKQLQLQQLEKEEDESQPKPQREIHIKRIFRLATPDEINLLLVKGQDEHKALVMCQQKTKQRKLPMEVVDAEYQWDRRKLTFFFEAENRIDFRELVRELFKIYKTRIWMCVVTPPITLDDIPTMTTTATTTTTTTTTNTTTSS